LRVLPERRLPADSSWPGQDGGPARGVAVRGKALDVGTEFGEKRHVGRLRVVQLDTLAGVVAVNSFELETIRVPTLLIHARDDPLVSYDAAERAANRIPGAHLVSLDSGGHLMVGQTKTVRNELASFLSERIAD
jgi:pimeloyl-ACP methyl ester carboxylesterase